MLGPSGLEPIGRSLVDLLVPAAGPDDDVPARAVAAVLGRIGLGEESGAALWVDPAGSWGAGPARGAWSKERAEYVGAGARETHRRTLLDRLRLEVHAAEQELETARTRVSEAERQIGLAQSEHAAYPVGIERDLVAAHERSALAGRELERARESVTQARSAWERSVADAQESAALSGEAAADLGLEADADCLLYTSDAADE